MSLEIIECSSENTDRVVDNYIKNKIMRMYNAEDDENNIAVLYIHPLIKRRRFGYVLVDKKRGISIIECKNWSFTFVEELTTVRVITANRDVVENPASSLWDWFNDLRRILEESKQLYIKKTFKYTYSGIMIMPNMSEEELKTLNYFYKNNKIMCFNRAESRNMKLMSLFKYKFSIEMSDEDFQVIRASISPEIKIIELSDKFNKNEEIDKKIKALDLEQEKIAKRPIDGHYLITGVPGSGKTIILLSRALFIAKEHTDWKILIVCYNKSLANKLKRILDNVSKDFFANNINKQNIIVVNFHKWLYKLCEVNFKSKDIKDNNKNNEYYMETWPSLAMSYAKPTFNAILVDEYQDLSDTSIKLLLKMCIKENNKENILLAGDRLQSIYNAKETSWKDIGINIVGRSSLLKTSYRAGKKHILSAIEFLKLDYKLKQEIDKFYDGDKNIDCIDYGEDIKFIEGKYENVIKIISRFIELGYEYKDILIICNSEPIMNKLFYLFNGDMKRNCIMDKKKFSIDDKMIVTTYKSVKGLENKIAILIDFDKVFDRKVAYVGMTRASEHLIIHANDYDNNNFANEIYNIVNSTKE